MTASSGRTGRKRASTRKSGSTRKTVALLCLAPAVLILLPSCVVLAPAMLPTAVAIYVDRSRDKCLALSVGALNFCGALVFLIELWSLGHDLKAAFYVLTNLFGWLSAFAGAALGWVIYLTMPVLVARVSAARQRIRLAELRALQSELVEEWGPAVAEGRSADEAS
jgi:hypothetical protein